VTWQPRQAAGPTLTIGLHTAHDEWCQAIARQYHTHHIDLHDAIELCAHMGYVLGLDQATSATLTAVNLATPQTGQSIVTDEFRVEIIARIHTDHWPAPCQQ
jgi:hypothetical protein